MFSDEQIEHGRKQIEENVGRWRANWYAESCQVMYGDHSEAALWKCRYREVALEYAQEVAALRASRDLAIMEIRRLRGQPTQS